MDLKEIKEETARLTFEVEQVANEAARRFRRDSDVYHCLHLALGNLLRANGILQSKGGK